jgi:hypothetical protein
MFLIVFVSAPHLNLMLYRKNPVYNLTYYFFKIEAAKRLETINKVNQLPRFERQISV